MKGKLKRDISIPILSREISTVISFGWISRLNKQSMARENKQLVAQFEEDYFFFFFLISNKDLLLSKRERHPSTQEVYKGIQFEEDYCLCRF